MVATITGQPLAASDARDRSGTAGNSAADRARPPSITSRRAADRHLGPSRRLATPVSDARSAWMASRTRCSVTCASPRSAGRSGVVPARSERRVRGLAGDRGARRRAAVLSSAVGAI